MYGEELVLKSSQYIQDRTASVVKEHETLRGSIKINMEQNPELTGEAFATDIKARLQNNFNTLTQFYNTLQKLNICDQASDTILKNPIIYIQSQCLEALGDDESIACQVADGALPKGYADQEIPLLGESVFWGTSEPSFYANLLILMAKKRDEPIGLRSNSSLFHVTSLKPELAEYLKGYEFLHENSGFGFVHTGYVNEGTRNDGALYSEPKRFAASDCSLFVKDMLDLKHTMVTKDMLFSCRARNKVGLIENGWHTTPRAIELCQKLVEIPIYDVRPGDIHLLSDFSEKDTNSNLHYHGHTTIVHSKQGSEVLTLGLGQHPLPLRDGHGFEYYSMQPKQEFSDGVRETRFLRLV